MKFWKDIMDTYNTPPREGTLGINLDGPFHTAKLGRNTRPPKPKDPRSSYSPEYDALAKEHGRLNLDRFPLINEVVRKERLRLARVVDTPPLLEQYENAIEQWRKTQDAYERYLKIPQEQRYVGDGELEASKELLEEVRQDYRAALEKFAGTPSGFLNSENIQRCYARVLKMEAQVAKVTGLITAQRESGASPSDCQEELTRSQKVVHDLGQQIIAEIESLGTI